MRGNCIMWSRAATEDEKRELVRLSSMKGVPVDDSDPDAPRVDASRKIYRGTPSFVKAGHEHAEIKE
jgi:hypothetical protein